MAASPSPRTHVRWIPILALVAVGTMINYLDRTVLGIAAPFLTKDLGPDRGEDGPGLLRLLVELRAAADSRRHLPRSVRHAPHLLHRRRLLVRLHRVDGRRALAERAGPDADRRRRLRSAVLSREQPDSRDLVSAAGARAGELDLFLRPVRRPRASSACRCSGSRSSSAGAACSSSSAASASCSASRGGCSITSRRRAGRANRAEIDYIEAGGGGEYKGAAGHVQVASHRGAAALPAGAGRLARPVRRQLDAGVLRHLVSDLSRHRARDDVHPGRADDLAAVHRRVGRRARRRVDLGPDPQANRIGEPVAQAADRRRHAAGVDDRRRQLRPDRAATAS